MAIDFTGRTAVVTGAGAGLGRSHAMFLASRGARVVVNDLGGSLDGHGDSRDPAREVVDEIRAAGGEAVPDFNSVAERESAERIIETARSNYGGIDILICNAGILRDRTFINLPPQDFDTVMNVHLMGTVHTARAAFPLMRERGHGRMVFTTSVAGLFGNFGQTNYAAAKLGVVGFMNALKLEGSKYGVLVNTIAPLADTRMAGPSGIFPDEVKHLLRPELVTAMVAYLCSDACRATGRVFAAGGGYYSMVEMVEGAGIRLDPRDDILPENIAANLDRIMDMSEAETFFNATEEFQRSIGPLLKIGK